MTRTAWGVAAAVVVAVVLLVAGVSKLARPVQWRSQAAGLGVPASVAPVVPIVEVIVGSLLLVQLHRHALAWTAAALFGSFTLVLVVNLARGNRPPCACFGSLSSKPIGPSHVARNVLFIAVALLAATL